MPPMPELWPIGVKGISLPEESLKKTTHQADVYQSFGTQLNFRAEASLVISIATIIDFCWVCHSTYLLIVTFNWELLGDTEQPKRILFHHSCCTNHHSCEMFKSTTLPGGAYRPNLCSKSTSPSWKNNWELDGSRYFQVFFSVYSH